FRVSDGSWYQAADFELPHAGEKPADMPAKEPMWLRVVAIGFGVLGNVPPAVTGGLSLITIILVAWFCLHTRPTVTSTDIGLRTAVDGGLLGLSWNSEAPAVKNATQVTLHIDDGSRTRDVPLDPQRVSAGMLLYRPQSASVIFRMELRGPQAKTQSSSARWVGRREMLAPGDFAMRAEETPASQGAGATQLAHAMAATHTPAAPANAAARPTDGVAKFLVKTPGARITIRRADPPNAPERLVGAGALRLQSGPWIVHASAPGFKPWTGRILVVHNSPKEVTIRLHQGRG